ncbi:hypothetical protein [Paraliomyxa miuraensis]|uniref:hypothetical protein n=1 Tax=Paraliomyxa miuraensis TaxID=376150 RepID=UPI002257687E|nr:hypothetical protein [Paraliomyxa miuraensis]MCX4243469.1 hypothetical protein [Paraliomyxa miuraensis]
MSIIPAPVGFGLFLVIIVATRIASERALRKLDTEAKGRLVEAFSSFRLASLIPLAAIAAIYLAMTQMDAMTSGLLLGIILPATLVFGVGMQLLVYRKLRGMDLDPAYLRVYSICRVAMLVGFVVLMLAL